MPVMTKVGHYSPPLALAIHSLPSQHPLHLIPKLQWLMLPLVELLESNFPSGGRAGSSPEVLPQVMSVPWP